MSVSNGPITPQVVAKRGCQRDPRERRRVRMSPVRALRALGEGRRHLGRTGKDYRTAPRGATSTPATPLANRITSRSPCLQRSTPASSASVARTWSITSSSLSASRSSYVTSVLPPLTNRTRSTILSMAPHTRRAVTTCDDASPGGAPCPLSPAPNTSDRHDRVTRGYRMSTSSATHPSATAPPPALAVCLYWMLVRPISFGFIGLVGASTLPSWRPTACCRVARED